MKTGLPTAESIDVSRRRWGLCGLWGLWSQWGAGGPEARQRVLAIERFAHPGPTHRAPPPGRQTEAIWASELNAPAPVDPETAG